MLDVTVPPETEIVSKEKKIVRPYIDVAEIRKAYPNPRSARDPLQPPFEKSRGYCVGGAFQRFAELGTGYGYPGSEIAWDLKEVNPKLSTPKALRFAERITGRNDWFDFEGAWQALKEALEYGCDTSKETNDGTRAAAQSPG